MSTAKAQVLRKCLLEHIAWPPRIHSRFCYSTLPHCHSCRKHYTFSQDIRSASHLWVRSRTMTFGFKLEKSVNSICMMAVGKTEAPWKSHEVEACWRKERCKEQRVHGCNIIPQCPRHNVQAFSSPSIIFLHSGLPSSIKQRKSSRHGRKFSIGDRKRSEQQNELAWQTKTQVLGSPHHHLLWWFAPQTERRLPSWQA